MGRMMLLIVALPLLSAVLAQLLNTRLGHRVARLSIFMNTLTFLAALTTLGILLSGQETATLQLGGEFGVLLLDPLSVLMCTVISGISLLVHIYSERYMVEEQGYARFYILLDLMTASLLIMVSAGDMVTLLVAWHLVGVLLYFLLGQDTRSEPAYRYGMWTFMTYRVGDLPLVLAAIMLWQTFDTLSLPLIFEKLSENPDIIGVWGLPVVETVAILVSLAAFARSAQFLLHNWLPYTMSGPTPVSALMHAGIVNAGGFLINRFAPVYAMTDGVLPWVLIVGLITAVIGSVLMLAQSDVKKALGYSTMGQMGFMVMECGAGAFSLAIFHLIAHGLFKGTLFLSAGSVIGEARAHDGVPKKPMYTFIVERSSPGKRPPWVLMALITLIVPAVVFAGAHFWVAPDLFQKQGAIVLLFFGWVTGAQLVFATYKMETKDPWGLIGMMLFSFVLVVIGYSFISHAFDVFLYPDAELAKALYTAGSIPPVLFMVLMGVVAMAIVVSWFLTYASSGKSELNRLAGMRGGRQDSGHEMWLNFYALLQREFHTLDLYAALSHRLVQMSAKLNVWLRWG